MKLPLAQTGDETQDLIVDHLAVSGVFMPEEVSDKTSRFDAITLACGTNMVIKNSAASGARRNKLSNGFDWNSCERTPAVWEFTEGNVGHNNSGKGIRFWTNTGQDHHPRNTILYRNGTGIQNGAYKNGNRYTDMLLLEDGLGILHNTNSGNNGSDDGPGRYERVQVEAAEGPALQIGSRNLEATTYQEFIDCTLQAGPGAPKVYVTDGGNLWLALFRRCGLVPDDIVFETLDGGNDGSHVIIEHEDGRVWDINITGGQKVVTLR